MWDIHSYQLKGDYPIVLLAGGYLNGRPKALVELAGKPMIWYTLKALAEILPREGISQLVIVAPENNFPEFNGILDDFNLPIPVKLAKSGNTPLESFRNGVEEISNGDGIVIALASDTPLVKGSHILDLIARVDLLRSTEDLDLAYAVVSREAYKIRFPRSKRTFVSLKRGSFCGTGFLGVNTFKLKEFLDIASQLVQNRKSPLKMASILGWDLLVGLLLKRYTLLDLERVISERFNLRGKVLLSENPEIAFNVDTIEEIHLAKEYLRRAEIKTGEDKGDGI